MNGSKWSAASVRLILLRALLRVTPGLRHAVVAGFPDEEGNSVEITRALAAHLPVYWLVGESPEDVSWLVADVDQRFPIRALRRDTIRAYLAYITARYVFFTHGLYGSPAPPRHKIFVNLWHGDGPKKSKRFAEIRSTYAVSGTRLWGSQRPVYFGVPEDGVLVTGNPRIDQFARPADDEALSALGLDPGPPLVLWMPTYRKTEYRGRRIAQVRNWADAEELSRGDSARDLFEEVARAARQAGVTLAVKPHPLDADRYEALGLPVITGDALNRTRTTTYQLLGRSHGLITDYSSVWTDYLALDRPMAFHCPDIDAYEATRGLNVEGYRGLIPGPLLETAHDFAQFFRNCVDESVESKRLRARSAALVGAETGPGASGRLLDALAIAPDRHKPLEKRSTARRLRRAGSR